MTAIEEYKLLRKRFKGEVSKSLIHAITYGYSRRLDYKQSNKYFRKKLRSYSVRRFKLLVKHVKHLEYKLSIKDLK